MQAFGEKSLSNSLSKKLTQTKKEKKVFELLKRM